MPTHDSPRLLADIGSTFARFALETAPGTWTAETTLERQRFPDFSAALLAYIHQHPGMRIRHAAVAVNSPVDGDQVEITNFNWSFSVEAARQTAGLDTLVVLNDFTALAAGLPHLSADQKQSIGRGEGRPQSIIGLVGAGSGLGVSGLVPTDQGWVSLATEGGHVSFAPQDAREDFILAFARRRHPHVSAERLVSSSGLVLILEALQAYRNQAPRPLDAVTILELGLSGQDADCVEALTTFCALLGTVASNLAVCLGALGGIYIAGGIPRRLGAFLNDSPFRERFESKGRFSGYVARIPTYLITSERASFTGIAAVLDAELKRRRTQASVLDHVRQQLPRLSPAERRVAELVLAKPRTFLNEPLMEVARIAGVSQPTVIRFCRSLGVDGLAAFRLQLASSLTGTIPVGHAQIEHDDTTQELGAKMLGNAARLLLQLRERMNHKAVDRAVGLLAKASTVLLVAPPWLDGLAQDVAHRMMRMGLPATCATDQRSYGLRLSLAAPQETVLWFTDVETETEITKTLQALAEKGLTVIAIGLVDTPHLRNGPVCIPISVEPGIAPPASTPLRLEVAMVLDILLTGISTQKTGEHGALTERKA